MRRAASFHRDKRWRQTTEELQNLAAPQLAPQNWLFHPVNAMELKYAF
jgi:hypothetical protein